MQTIRRRNRDGACEVVEFDLTPVVSTRGGASTIAEMVRASETRRQLPVHLGIDTGLHGIGISRYPVAVFSIWATDGNG